MRFLVILSAFLISLITYHLSLITFSSAHSQTQVIKMTANGFDPQRVTIDTSSTVIFVNQDKEAHWPASNPHPTHELFAEFDPRKPIEPGQDWTFKPKKVGIWKFHDHLFPHLRGELTVTKESSFQGVSTSDSGNSTNLLDKIKSFFANLGTKVLSIFNRKKFTALDGAQFMKLTTDKQSIYLKDLADKTGSESVWQFLKQNYKGQSGTSGNIHDLAHLTGSIIFDKKGFTGLGICSSEFAFGCYHGFLDTAFSKNLDHLSDAENGCLKLGPENSGPVASCIHGIGHGIASFYLTNDLQSSLSTCRKLTSGREFCFDGVFMEFVRSAPDSFYKRDDLSYPCDYLETKYGSTYSFACGRNQPTLLMIRFKLPFDQVVETCLKSGSKAFKEACFDSLGFSLAATGDENQIINGCQKINEPEFTARCIKAAAGELVFQEVPGWEEKSKAVCDGEITGQDECLANVNRIIKEYNRKINYRFSPKKDGEDLNSYLRKQFKVCYDAEGRDDCYKKLAQALYGSLGFTQTLASIRENEGYQEVYARCHEVTHYLSRAEYATQKSIAKVYSQCDSTCHGGCYHGVLEAYLKEKNDLEGVNLASEFVKVCGAPEDYQKPIEFNECLHGMGHAAMFVTEMYLPKSLKLCDGFGSLEQRWRCFTGVFMENSSSSTSRDHASIYIKASDPNYPCNILEERYQEVCWQYQSSYFAILSHQDWRKVAEMCLKVPKKYQDKCFLTIGTNQVGFTTSMEVMKQDCGLMPDANFKNLCITGVVSSMSYRFVGDINKLVDFCTMVETDNKESCYKQIGSGVKDWYTDKELAKQNCSKIVDPKGASWCMSVI